MKKNKKRNIFAIVLLIFCLSILGVIVSFFTVEKQTKLFFSDLNVGEISVYSQTLGNVERNIPTSTKNEGLCERYPVYGTSLSNITDEEKDNILKEDSLLRVSSSTYDEIDEEGNLLLNGEKTGKKLYKHSASVGMYYGDVSDEEKAVVQEITITPKEYRNYVTGLYAPAGEIIKIEISQEDLSSIGGLVVSVGQISHVNKNNNIWKAKNNFCRMPNLGNLFTITKETTYVGNYLGGPIYLKANKIGVEYTVKISGAVKYTYYIHGLTTKEEFEGMKSYSAPYYDFEIWDLGVRHSGPKAYANFDYDNLVKVGNLWEKICRTSRQVPNTSKEAMGICFIYDVFVAAGEACAFQGNNWVNAPCYWFPGALNYQVMTTTGFWGQIHEFNHHYQNYGIAPNIEVSNNATSLLSYVLYTNISASRSENDSTLTGWNRFTDATRSLRETLGKVGQTQTDLNIYADIIHSFGVDTFIKATKYQTGGYTADAWYEALSKATGYNMTYYFEDLLGHSISDSMKEKYDLAENSVYIPVAMLYQTGRNIYVNNKEQFIETMRPFEIVKGQEYILDFDKNTYVPDGFEWSIKNVTTPQNGTLTKIDNKKYSYLDNGNIESGVFYITISISKDNNYIKDVTFSINLKTKDPKPTKTLYTYETRKYEIVDDAVNNNFSDYTSKTISYEATTFMNHIANKQIGVVEGKIYIDKDGEYTICLRAGRGNHALYTSLDGVNYSKDIYFSGDYNAFDLNEAHTKKYILKQGQYLYYKQVTISNGHSDAYTELGITSDETQPKSILASVLYNKDAVGYVEYNFDSKSKFEREYSTISSLTKSNTSKQKFISTNFGNWSDETKIENIFDGNLDTFYHNSQNVFVSKENPFELVADLGENLYCNKITFIGRKTSQLNLPCSFKLYAGTSLENMQLVGEYEDLSIVNRKTFVRFEPQEIRYYKIVVYDTKSENGGNKYVCISQIDFECDFQGKQYNPTKLEYYQSGSKTFNMEKAPSTYGYKIVGNGKISYTFTGNQFGIILNQSENVNFKIKIDGQEYNINAENLNKKYLAFISKELNSGEHKVEIFILSGKIAIDSFVVR